jgi:hypothetical protein
LISGSHSGSALTSVVVSITDFEMSCIANFSYNFTLSILNIKAEQWGSPNVGNTTDFYTAQRTLSIDN